MIDANRLHRTAKLLLDEGRARSPEEAEAILSGYVLQVDVAPDIDASPTRQAMLLTILNTGRRAFLGGVRVCLRDNPILTIGWARGLTAREAVERYGGSLVDELDEEQPTLAIGHVKPQGRPVLHPTWEGWSAGIVECSGQRLREDREFALAGVLASALGVSECFQYLYGSPCAGRRSFGISLWSPGGDWTSSFAPGPPCLYLPSRYWLLGLGHLGQAYAWTIGLLPYPELADVEVMLQDFDFIVHANESTSLLADAGVLGQRKTRMVARELESLGFKTSITERAFDTYTQRAGEEPRLALAGFDSPAPRRALERAGFDLIVDAGLGRGPRLYLEMLLHSFPSGLRADETFASSEPPPPPDLSRIPAYSAMIEELIAKGLTEGEAACGAVEVAGRAVGASFVGAVAACLGLSEPLRILNGGRRYEVIDLSLYSPEHLDAVECEVVVSPTFGFVRAASAMDGDPPVRRLDAGRAA